MKIQDLRRPKQPLDEISRRGFLKTMGGAALGAAGVSATQPGEAGQRKQASDPFEKFEKVFAELNRRIKNKGGGTLFTKVERGGQKAGYSNSIIVTATDMWVDGTPSEKASSIRTIKMLWEKVYLTTTGYRSGTVFIFDERGEYLMSIVGMRPGLINSIWPDIN